MMLIFKTQILMLQKLIKIIIWKDKNVNLILNLELIEKVIKRRTQLKQKCILFNNIILNN